MRREAPRMVSRAARGDGRERDLSMVGGPFGNPSSTAHPLGACCPVDSLSLVVDSVPCRWPREHRLGLSLSVKGVEPREHHL